MLNTLRFRKDCILSLCRVYNPSLLIINLKNESNLPTKIKQVDSDNYNYK